MLTHHPSDWLHPDSRERHLHGEIMHHGIFALHLCGHTHVPDSLGQHEAGAEPRWQFRGRSLCGLELIAGTGKIERLHGYAAGRIELDGERGRWRLWPRTYELKGGQRDPDRDASLLKRGRDNTGPVPFKALRPCRVGRRGSAPQTRRSDGASPGVRSAEPLAQVIDGQLAPAAVSILAEALRGQLALPSDLGLGAALCGLAPDAAPERFWAAARSARLRYRQDGWIGAPRAAAVQVLGLLLWRCLCARGDADPLLLDLEVQTDEGAEVLWMHWKAKAGVPEFRILPDRLLGKHNALPGDRLNLTGHEDPAAMIDQVKRCIWQALFPITPPPRVFGDDEDRRLLRTLQRRTGAIGDIYGTWRLDRETDPLHDPVVLGFIRDHLGLPIVTVRATEQTLFEIDEIDLRDQIETILVDIAGEGR